MSPDMQQKVCTKAKELYIEAQQQNKPDKDVAQAIKTLFDKANPGSTWHCIVGSHFGVSVTHDTENLVFLSIGDANILLFRSF
jgi:dynein light chain LC8-type